ncbi:MAG: low specificity L-threonine aldolase [Cyanobacteria bacterium REEB446]|nr:low specificity L-threonine aldolase [Cyanobacteria bacterium REEB446]
MNLKSFASDNYSGIHPKILDAIVKANLAHAPAYGADELTRAAISKFKEQFGSDREIFFVFNGTAANVLGLASVTESYNSIICAETSHLYVDECGAPEFFTGVKLTTVKTTDGKLTAALIKPHLIGFDNQHNSQPKVISIANSTELGTVYKPDEIRVLADLAHEHGMLLHLDGARLANASASLGLSLKEVSFDLGVDLLSFGGTKNGMLLGEAIIFRDASLAEGFKYRRKQGMQLASKMRFISAQFLELLSNDLYLENAKQANRMAKLLAEKIKNIPDLEIVYAVEANGVFVKLPRELVDRLQAKHSFYIWSEAEPIVRWMCSFDTCEADIEGFVQDILGV